jgi:hypothetical protein
LCEAIIKIVRETKVKCEDELGSSVIITSDDPGKEGLSEAS